MKVIEELEKQQLKKKVSEFKVGDTVTVTVKIVEEGKERTQNFSGVVIGRRGKGISESFTVRHVTSGYGVERVFLFNSPRITKIKVTKEGKVRRSKLYYLRKRVGKKATKVKEKETITA